MSKGGSSQIVGFRYYMSILFGICVGPVDRLGHIRANKLNIFSNSAIGYPPQGNDTFRIDAPDVFGGDDQEGGIDGTAIIQMGQDDQIASATIKGTIGGNVSDLRGWFCLWFDGLVASNNKYLKAWDFQVLRGLKGWYLDNPWYPNELWMLRGINPAHIIVECLTNPVWGRGYLLSQLDEESFRSAANTLCDESFGLNFNWARDVTLTQFISIVINHIGASLYTDRITGLVAIKLLRQDYDPAELPVFDYTSGLMEILDDATTAPDSSHNELVVNFISPDDGEKRQVRIQNLAGIQASNNIASTSVDYLGAPNGDIAGRIGQRDMSIQAAGIRKFTLKMDRRARKIQPGGVFRIAAPDRSIADMVLRCASIEQGDIRDQTLTVKCLQDVFALEVASYVVVQDPTWVPPDNSPISPTLRRIDEINYRDVVRALAGNIADLAGVDMDEGDPVLVAATPTGLSPDYILASRTDPFDFGLWTDHGRFPWTPTATLAASIGYYDTTAIQLTNVKDFGNVTADGIAWLEDELVEITAVDQSNLTIDIRRGCVDSVPARHSTGARIWFPEHAISADQVQYTTGELVYYCAQAETSAGLSPTPEFLPDATADAWTIAGRQGRPYPMGALTINGTPFGSALTQAAGGDLDFDGTDRDRLTQADQILAHEDGDTGPEPGTTYNYRFYNNTGTTPLRTVTGLTDPAFTYTAAMYLTDGTPSRLRVEAESERDGLASYFHYNFTINRSGVLTGWGRAWGSAWGSPSGGGGGGGGGGTGHALALFYDDFSGGLGNWTIGFPWEAGVNVYAPTYVQVDAAATLARINPFTTGGGGLTIKADLTAGDPDAGGKLYYTGLLASTFSRLFGYFEFKSSMPSSPGQINGANWLYPITTSTDSEETDVIEHQGTYVMQTVWDGSPPNPTNAIFIPTVTSPHVYGVEWNNTNITFYVDGVQTFQTGTPTNHLSRAMALVLSINIFNPASDGSSLPDTMNVEYVGVWTDKATRDSDV